MNHASRRVFLTVALLVALLACSDEQAPGPMLCLTDSDCPGEQICSLGACRDACTTSTDCPEDMVCVSGACIQPCADDEDCHEKERCENGYCVPLSPEDGGLPDGDPGDAGAEDGGDEEACAPGTQERCGTDEGTCQSGTRTCREDGTWSECQGEIPPEDETCDGRDNDCDASTDEDVTPPGDVCLREGVCTRVEIRCQGGRWFCRYPVDYQAGTEQTCDGLDNDCDGQTDEESDLVAPPGLCPQSGICAAGVESVCRSGGWTCNFPPEYEPDEASCDGLDNDCDGATDEGLRDAPPGTCIELGICAQALTPCIDGQWECRYPVGYQPSGETVCDGMDNDCDGQTDEDLQAQGVCSPHGVCAGTAAVCENAVWMCHYPPEYRVPDDTCDGVDNDCDGVPDSGLFCGGVCCALGEICRFDACITDQGGCSVDGDCQEDSYCDNGDCIPYGTGPREDTNPDCTRLIVAGLFQPALQCEWTAPPAGDPYPDHLQVLGTPMVANFDFDSDPQTIKPSIVFNTYDALDGDSGVMTALDGVIRIIDGETCQTQFSLGPYTNGCNPVAIGDLDADGRPEIVAHRNNGGVIAYRYDSGSGSWAQLWVGHDGAGTPVTFTEGSTGWGGPSLCDLNDDGSPEVLSGGLVYDATGLLIDNSLSLSVLFRVGFPVAADLDGDGKVELAGGNAVWEFDPVGLTWVAEWSGTGSGYTAVADFGTYTAVPAQDDRGTLDGIAEVAVVAGGQARIDTIGGRTVFGPITLPASSGGGPPTIGDFDGDGRAELAAAGSDSYTVFDPDCTGAPQAQFCPTLQTGGILWTRPSQDHSSNITGSSLFDFEGDGFVEAVYADECFVRVYNGSDGTVLYSQWRSSCTWNENPVVADVDGDFSAELVVPSNRSCGTAPQNMGGTAYETSPHGNPMDPLFVGLPCVDSTDCASGVCDSGFCRCTADAECGGGGFVCAPPPAGTPGSGNTCRAEWLGSINGVRVYRDSLDRWVGSRFIWNQHAYAISNVLEDGTVPRTSLAELNWQVAGLNNFRQNIQGDLNPAHSPDMTSGQGTFAAQCDQGALTLTVRVCNRGTNPIASGVSVGFFDGDPDQGGVLVCTTTTTLSLNPGECEMVNCDWQNAPISDPHDITVVVDYDTQRTECLETNNRAMIPGATCPYL